MAKPPLRKPKKKVCVFCQERIAYVDYKDTGLLRKYISDRGKIRARRVTGNTQQQQRQVAHLRRHHVVEPAVLLDQRERGARRRDDAHPVVCE